MKVVFDIKTKLASFSRKTNFSIKILGIHKITLV